MFKRLVMLVAATSVSLVLAQAVNIARSYTNHATLIHQTGKVLIEGSSPRPVEQALAELRREYGAVIDYEEGPNDSVGGIRIDSNQRRLVGGSYSILVSEPSSLGRASVQPIVTSFLAQMAASHLGSFSVLAGENNRMSVASSVGAERILDTPIVLSSTTRSIDQAVDSILQAVSHESGKALLRGGLVDGEMSTKVVSVGSSSPVPARFLLAKALDASFSRKYWIQTWEPSDGNFYIGIQTVVRTVITPSGAVKELPVR